MCCALWFFMLSFMCVSSCPRMCLILDLTFLDPSSILILPNGSTLFYSSTALSTDYVYFFIVLLISWWRVLRMCDVTYFPYIHPFTLLTFTYVTSTPHALSHFRSTLSSDVRLTRGRFGWWSFSWLFCAGNIEWSLVPPLSHILL